MSTFDMIKIILFDADGVLINGKKFADVLEVDYGLTREHTRGFFGGKFLDCLVGKADLKKELELHLIEWNIDKTVEEFMDYWFKTEHKINEQLVEYIQQLRKSGIKCYVATNNEKHRVNYMLDTMGFRNTFDGVFSSADLGAKKPDEKFYGAILKRFNEVNLTTVMLWDDEPENVEAAKKAGMNGEIYSTFEEFISKITSLH